MAPRSSRRSLVCPDCQAETQVNRESCRACGFEFDRPEQESRPGRSLPVRLPRIRLPGSFATALQSPPFQLLTAFINRAQSSLRFSGDQAPGIPLSLELALVTALTLIAFILRVDGLAGGYPGIHQDEMRSIKLVLRILDEGWVGLFFRENAGMGTGTHYMAVPYFLVGGPVWEMWKLSIAVFGVALVPVTHLLVKRLFNVRIALITTALLTFCVWLIMQSRIGWDVMPSLFFFVAGIYLLFVGLDSKRIAIVILAGLVFTVGLYTSKMFLIYFLGVMAVTAATVLGNPAMRRRSELYAFLAVSLAAGAPMLWFYLFSDYNMSEQLAYYRFSLRDIPFKIPEYVQNAWNLFLLVHNPMHHPQSEGAGGIPILRPFIAEVFFWLGLVATLLCIRKTPCQLLLVGWLIAMAPSIFLPDGEARRYTLGMICILVIVAIGIEAFLVVFTGRVSTIIENRVPDLRRFARWLPASFATVFILAFVTLFAVENRSHFNHWRYDQALWHFDYELVAAGRYLQTLQDNRGNGYELRIYSVRWSIDHHTLKYLVPGLRGVNGDEKFGGDGTITSGGPITGDTVFLFTDVWLEKEGFTEQAEAAYPGGYYHRETDEHSGRSWVVYVIDAP